MIGMLFGNRPRCERRYASRYKTRNLVLVSVPRGTEKMMNLVDLSFDGLQLSSCRPLPQNRILSLKINLAEQDSRVSVMGRVIWSKMAAGTGSLYRVGVSFVEVSQEAWHQLHHYLTQADAA